MNFWFLIMSQGDNQIGLKQKPAIMKYLYSRPPTFASFIKSFEIYKNSIRFESVKICVASY